MRVLVTGATGVVGRQAVPRLLQAGHTVAAGVEVVVQESVSFPCADGGARWLDEAAPVNPTVAAPAGPDERRAA
jgi:nucleoside-diphosphate-sugar epimerase